MQTVLIQMRWLIWAVSSGSTLFAILFWFFAETPIWNNGSGQSQRWKSPLQKLRDEMVKSQLSHNFCLAITVHRLSLFISYFCGGVILSLSPLVWHCIKSFKWTRSRSQVFGHIWQRGNFWDLLLSCIPSPFWKGSFLKAKEISSLGEGGGGGGRAGYEGIFSV